METVSCHRANGVRSDLTIGIACDIVSGRRPNRVATLSHSNRTADIPPGSSSEITEVNQVFETAADAITGLMHISIVIRDATPRDRYLRAEKGTKTPFLSSFDIDHVGHKFPKINSKGQGWLKTRLGCAITQRRQYLKYCRDHHDKFTWQSRPEAVDASSSTKIDLLKPSDQADTEAGANDGTGTVISAPASAFAPTDASTLQVSKLRPMEKVAEDLSETYSQTSYATSIDDDYDESRLEFPRLADITRVFPFECPYCWTILEVKNEKSWR